MDKEEIIRICKEYNNNQSYELAFGKSKDLGLMKEVIPYVQENIPSLQASLASLWKIESRQLAEFAYLSQVIAMLPKAAVRLVGIKHIPRKKSTTFSFAFNLAGLTKAKIKIQGIPVISFGVALSIFANGPSGKGKLLIFKSKPGSEKYTPLKKAS